MLTVVNRGIYLGTSLARGPPVEARDVCLHKGKKAFQKAGGSTLRLHLKLHITRKDGIVVITVVANGSESMRKGKMKRRVLKKSQT